MNHYAWLDDFLLQRHLFLAVGEFDDPVLGKYGIDLARCCCSWLSLLLFSFFEMVGRRKLVKHLLVVFLSSAWRSHFEAHCLRRVVINELGGLLEDDLYSIEFGEKF